MKRFISIVPLQGVLNPVKYSSEENSKIAYDGKTAFPIIHLIANYAQKGEKIIVNAILTDYDSARKNYELLCKEVEQLSKKIGFLYELEIINTPYDENIDIHLRLINDIVGVINDGDKIYACITYGTKPTPIIVSLSLYSAYKLMKDVSVECIVYGRLDHATNTAHIHDTTALFYLTSVTDKLSSLNPKDPKAAFSTLLGDSCMTGEDM